MDQATKIHNITLQYLSQFDYTNKTPEEYTNIYLDISSKVSKTFEDYNAKFQNDILESLNHML